MGAAERVPGVALALLVLERLDRLLRPLERLVAAIELHRPARLRRPQRAHLGAVAGEPEQPLRTLEVRPGLLRLAVGDHHVRAGQVRAGELEGVVGRLEQRDRPPQVREGPREPSLLGGRPGTRPVEPDAAVDVADRLEPLLRVEQRHPRTRRVAARVERLAQIRSPRLPARGR